MVQALPWSMTWLLYVSASPDAPVACDMTAAQDTLAERLAEYRRLFEHALVDQEATVTSTTYRLADRPGVREWVLDLVGREAACCPFLSLEVHFEGGHVVWRVEGLGAADLATVGDVLTTADRSGASEGLARDLTDRGRVPILTPVGSGRRQGDRR